MASVTALLAMAYANRALYSQDQKAEKRSNTNEWKNSSANKEEEENKKKKQLFGGWKVSSHEDDNTTIKTQDVATDTKL
jgi:hypothetical protein